MAEIDLTTDRDLSAKTESYELWLPKNQGPEDSWAVLLNENFTSIDGQQASIAESINSILSKEAEIEGNLGTERARVTQNILRLDSHDARISSNSLRLTGAESLLNDAAGNMTDVGTRLDILTDDDGVPLTENILADVKRLQWNKYTKTGIGIASYFLIPDVFATGGENKTASDGNTFGVIVEGSTNRYGMVYDSQKRPIYSENGIRVICKLSQSGDDLQVELEEVTGSGYTINQSGNDVNYDDIIVFYPEIVDAHNVGNTPDQKRLYSEVVNPATATMYGVIKQGHRTDSQGANVDKVDGIHASSIPVANYLFPLNISGEFSADHIGIEDFTGHTQLSQVFPYLLRTENVDTFKSITDYIGAVGDHFFPLAAAGNTGAQFTKSIQTLEQQLDNATDGVASNLVSINNEITRAISGESINANDIANEIMRAQNAEQENSDSLNAEITRAITREDELADEIIVIEDVISGEIKGEHFPDPDAHHSSISSGLDISPASVVTNFAEINTAVIQDLLVQRSSTVHQEVTFVDKFIDINAPSGEISGEAFISGEYGSAEVPNNENYTGGFVIHKGFSYALSGEYSLIRYNANAGELQACNDWQPSKISGESDGNKFITLGDQSATEIASHPGEVAFGIDAVELAIAAAGVVSSDNTRGGKALIREGEFIEDATISGELMLEGMGVGTYLNGDITVTGNNNKIQHLRTNNITIEAGAKNNQILFNHIVGNIVDNSGNATNLMFGNMDYEE